MSDSSFYINSNFFLPPYFALEPKGIKVYSDKTYTIEEFAGYKDPRPAGKFAEVEFSDDILIWTTTYPDENGVQQVDRTVMRGAFIFNGNELVSGTISSLIGVQSRYGDISGKVFSKPISVVFSEFGVFSQKFADDNGVKITSIGEYSKFFPEGWAKRPFEDNLVSIGSISVDSPEQVVIKPFPQQVDIAPSQRGSLFRVESDVAPEIIVNLKGSSDLIEINAEVSATLNAVTTENWGTGYVAWNVGSTLQAGTGERVSLNGLGKYSFVATAINAATSTIVLEQGKNSAFFLHDAYSAFYEGLTVSTDSTGRQSAARILDFDVIKMGSAGGNSIVDLTSKDYITGAVTVHGADKGRSIFWGTDSDDTFLSGGGDSVVFGGGGFNQSILGAGKDVLQFRSTVDSTNLIRGFDPTKDVLELWSGRTETVGASTFITEGDSTTMTWGNNTIEFEGIIGLSAKSLMISTQFAA